MGAPKPAFFRVHPGLTVESGGERYEITHLLTLDGVLAKHLETGKSEHLRIESLKLPEKKDQKPAVEERDLLQLSEDEWKIAQERLELIKPLLSNAADRTAADVASVAEKKGVHLVTVYKWIRRYQLSGHVASLVPDKPGRKTGSRFLNQAVEAVIRGAIEDRFLSKERATPKGIVEEVHLRCKRAGLTLPSEGAIRKRLDELSQADILRKRGYKHEARDRFDPIRDSFPGADYPLSVVQIDHTPANVMVVDEVTRQSLGKPFLTLAIDVKSRMVVGIYLSLDPPSRISVGLCLAQAICQKRDYLAKLGVGGEWPVWGTPGAVHSDNAKEFRSDMLKRACNNYGAELIYRPGKTPHMGGHIERLMGAAASIFREIPGRTFASVKERKGYDSDKEAVMTLLELEAYFVDAIINKYHKKFHAGVNMTPQKAWEKGLLGDEAIAGIGIPPVPADPFRIQLDFTPSVERTCQRYGFLIDNIYYYDPVLDPYINALNPDDEKHKQMYHVRVDPRDISQVYFLDPADNRYVRIPYRHRGRPAISAWESKAAVKALREEGRADIDEDMLFETVERLRKRIDDAKNATKGARGARRAASRRPPGQRPKAATSPQRQVPIPEDPGHTSIHAVSNASSSASLEDDIFAEPVTAFDVVLQR